MNLWRDGSDEVRRRRPLDDATAEALIAGDTGAGTDDLAALSAFLEEVRALGEGAPPPPSAALARMLAGEHELGAGNVRRLVGDQGAPASPPAAWNGHRRRAGAGSRQPSAGVVAKAAVLAMVATASVTGAAAARLLPEPAQKAVSRAIETVTPFELPPARGAGEGGAGEGATGEALSRQGEPFDPAAGDRPLGPADDPGGRSDDGPADRPAAARGTGAGATPRPGRSSSRSEDQVVPRRPAEGGSTTTVSPAPATPAETTPADGPAEPAPAPLPGGRTYTASLSGDADPARPGDPDGAGRASVTVHSGRRLLCVALTTSGTAPVTSVHLHRASAPSADPIVAGGAPAGDGSPECFAVDDEVLRKLRTDPAGHYVEVHNAEFPEGALRGSLSP